MRQFTLIFGFILLWFDFGTPGYALFAVILLAIGIIWMVELIYMASQQFTVMNVMGLSMILGIGEVSAGFAPHFLLGWQHVFGNRPHFAGSGCFIESKQKWIQRISL